MTKYHCEQQPESGAEGPQLEPGLQLAAASSTGVDCYTFMPDNLSRFDRILVCVHGVSRNALEQIRLLRPYAQRYGFALIAPLFKQSAFRDYQRLGRRDYGPRADLALIRALQTIDARTPLNTSKFNLFGFSGGAQFAHRFAFAHSQRVNAMILGAAGWYTMPDATTSYPLGTADAKGLDLVRFNVRSATRLPTLVAVGAEDTDPEDQELNGSRKISRRQGKHRVARAKAWVQAMNASAVRHGSDCDIQLRLLPGVRHSFSDAVDIGGLGQMIFEFLDRPMTHPVPGRLLSLTRNLPVADAQQVSE